MKLIGLTGSIAMGKSEVAKVFAAAGIPVFDADAEVHRLYDSPEGAKLIKPLVPDAVKNNRVDRPSLAKVALADPVMLKRLEKIIHAEIAERRRAFVESAHREGAAAVLLDIPLLYETGAERGLDAVIVISARPELQRARALARSGMTAERFDAILARQIPDAEKRARATYVVDNNGTLEELQQKTRELLAKLMR